MSDQAGAALLAFACAVLRATVRGGRQPDLPDWAELRETRGVFVTLHARDHLRGCLGHIQADLPLLVATAEMAAAVTKDDPRFSPVRTDELAGLHVEVSVLSPFRPIAPDEVVVGRDGLMIRRGRFAGLLLPQVATEHRLDRAAFLRALCQKAMLPDDAWREPGTELLGFTAQRFDTTMCA
ncbi:MAG: AmmeMemoRadiSam system protein A [Gemmatimonadota bacterium]